MSHYKLLSLAVVLLAFTACKEDKNPVRPPVDTTTPPPPPPDTTPPPVKTFTVMAAGNISSCTNTNDAATAALIAADTAATVIALGDNAFPNGTAANYTECYGPTWGAFKARTYALFGNHDYDSSATAAGAAGYFGDRAGPAGKHYYSFDLGDWHVIVLNVISGLTPPVAYAPGSEQATWLAADLAANSTKKCVMAVWHDPRFLSSDTAGFNERTTQRALWQTLYDAGVDIVLNGSAHMYERMQPMDAAGAVDTVRGIRQFNSGLGGESRYTTDRTFIHPASASRGFEYGVLKLTLGKDSYSWQFLPVAGATFADTGTGACH